MTQEFNYLLNSTIKLLGRRPYSRLEIDRYLHRKSSDSSVITAVIDKLIQLNLINDKAFASWLVESRSRSSPRGQRLLKSELKTKGIDHNNAPNLPDEVPLAIQTLTKKLPLWRKLPYRDFFTKAHRYLAYRGFSWPTIEQVVKNLYNSSHVTN